MAKKSVGTAYGLWCLSLIGICGVQRFYAGESGIGILYLLTFGFCGIAQLIDLILIPEIIKTANHKSGGNEAPQQQVIVNIGETIANQLATQKPSLEAATDEQLVLQCCSKESASLAQICLATGLSSSKAKALVEQLTIEGLLLQQLDGQGCIRYRIN